jgi:multimeric flavodoxin WrbA
MAKKIVAIDGSYRRGGTIAQAVDAAAGAAQAGGADVRVFRLAEKNVLFCDNCRACAQAPGTKRGHCPLVDDMNEMLDAIEAADGLILAAPVNCFNVNALTRRFMERMTPYAHWPWGTMAPAMRLKAGAKKAVLITSSAMPSFFGRLATGAMRALKFIALGFGARTAGTLFIGLASMEPKPPLPPRDRRLAENLGRVLLK